MEKDPLQHKTDLTDLLIISIQLDEAFERRDLSAMNALYRRRSRVVAELSGADKNLLKENADFGDRLHLIQNELVDESKQVAFASDAGFSLSRLVS